MDKAQVFNRSTYDPVTQQSSAVFKAAATQVRANYKADRLEQLHSAGHINDHKYIKELKNLTQEYRKGTGLHRELRSETVGAAQGVAAAGINQVAENKVQFSDEALATWNAATSAYATGSISPEQYQQAHQLYLDSLSGQRAAPTPQEVTKQVLQGKYWDQYKSGRVRNIMREKQIKGVFKAVTGDKIDPNQLHTLAGGEGSLNYINSQILNDAGKTRDLGKEQIALQDLKKKLGRLPTRAEINAQVYGG